MSQTKLLKTITLALTALVITACANTKPVGEWSNEQFTGKLNNILIIGVTSRSDRRQLFEDKFVEGLATLKVNATPSYKLMDSSLHLTRQVVENAIKGQDIGAVLLTRLAGIKDKDVYRAPDNQDENLSYFNYSDKSLQLADDGYTEQQRTVVLETNLYDIESRELVWSMQSETMDASQPRNVIGDQIELTINTLAKRGLI